jgi:hypothetical protein
MEIYDLAFKRGDTFGARDLITVEQPAGTALAVASARMQIRKTDGKLIYEWSTLLDSPNMSITGAGNNIVSNHAVSPSITSQWPPGNHEYDIELTLSESGLVLTPVGGAFRIDADVTRTD